MNTYFEHTLSYNGITFQLTNKSIPDEREMHTYHEILYFIEGDATLLTENSKYELKHQMLLMIPKRSYHFIQPNQKSFLRLKISIPEHSVQSFPVKHIFETLCVVEHLSSELHVPLGKLLQAVEKHDSCQSAFYAYAAFLMLLAEADAMTHGKEYKPVKQVGIVPEIIQYISENISGDLSVSAIAAKLNISPSAAIHRFKKEMGISLHSYIVQKRLFHARELIENGQKISKVYSDCGYMEYSSFYRAYVKFFGHSPSCEKDSGK